MPLPRSRQRAAVNEAMAIPLATKLFKQLVSLAIFGMSLNEATLSKIT